MDQSTFNEKPIGEDMKKGLKSLEKIFDVIDSFNGHDLTAEKSFSLNQFKLKSESVDCIIDCKDCHKDCNDCSVDCRDCVAYCRDCDCRDC